jgi:hypothetical protein
MRLFKTSPDEKLVILRNIDMPLQSQAAVLNLDAWKKAM